MKKFLLIAMLVAALAGCKERYDAPLRATATGYLVIEGVINSGSGSTELILSRSTSLSDRSIQLEKGANVTVVGLDNSIRTLQETSPGHYTATNLSLAASQKYKLSIVTNSGKKYASDYVPVKNNPPIDSVNWRKENDGIQLYVNTHDPADTTRYYQWSYTETWEYHSAYPAVLKYVVRQVRGKDIYSVGYLDSTTYNYVPKMYFCWKTQPSTNINLGSTAKLAKDVVQLPLIFIEPASWKVSVLYSVNVRQYVLSKEGYAFMETMKKNTEQTGSIFDPQPSQLNSNIHCLDNPAEPVIGYVSICPIQEKRIFIDRGAIGDWGFNVYDQCNQVKIPNISDSITQLGLGLLPSYAFEVSPRGDIVSFYASDPICVDCQLRGSSVKPSFWP